MIDIGNILKSTMDENQCSSLYAFLLLKAGEDNGIHICKSKSVTKSNGRLRDKGSKSSDKERLGNSIYGDCSARVYDARYAVF